MTKLSPETRDKLKGVSTATLGSALYKRGLRNQMIQDVRPLSAPKGGSMVGEAYTLRYMPAREDLNPMTVFRDHSHPQRRAVEECPPGAILVMDSRKDARAASAGGILVTRLMVRGVAGVVTDGGFRDSGEIAQLDIPSYHPGIVEEITADAVEMTAYEDFVTECVRAGQKTFGLYPPTDETNLEAFAVWRKQHGR
jgi:regulator of RNase E activity RraA